MSKPHKSHFGNVDHYEGFDNTFVNHQTIVS